MFVIGFRFFTWGVGKVLTAAAAEDTPNRNRGSSHPTESDLFVETAVRKCSLTKCRLYSNRITSKVISFFRTQQIRQIPITARMSQITSSQGRCVALFRRRRSRLCLELVDRLSGTGVSGSNDSRTFGSSLKIKFRCPNGWHVKNIASLYFEFGHLPIPSPDPNRS